MSDQEIIDTIDVSLREHMTPGAPSDGSYCCARAVLAALRERYAIVPRPEPPIGGYEHIVESGKKRYAIVELPSSTPGWWDCYEDDGDPPDHIVHGEECAEYVVTTWFEHSGEVQISHQGEPMEPISLSAARKFAAALLAAANYAEEDK